MRLAVAGGTGLVGTLIVEVARERGHEVAILSRSNGVDLTVGAGLADALQGVEVVIDVSNTTTQDGAKAQRFFRTATRRLVQAEHEAGVAHHLALSIVGIDRAPYGYYSGKLAQEREIELGQVPWTVLRATQFHEFAQLVLDRFSVGGVHLAPVFPTQPVAAGEVALRLVELAEGAPAGRVNDLAGPRDERMERMVRELARRTGLRGPVVPVAQPGKMGAAMRGGAALARADADRGVQTFAEWVDEVASRRAAG